MSESTTDKVRLLFKGLNENFPLIAEALDGAVDLGDKQRNRGVDALAALNALKPDGEHSYRLNPRLRDFLNDFLGSYHAFSVLTRITPKVDQAKAQFRELKELTSAGETRDADRLERALDDTVLEIAYDIERNLMVLHTNLSTEYGNVQSLQSKFRQNNFYAAEVSTLIKEMRQVDQLVERIADDALAAGLLDIRQMVRKRLGSRLLLWTSQVNDAQHVISKRLFIAKKVEARLRRISRIALWMRQGRATEELVVEMGDDFDVALLRPTPVQVISNYDVGDDDPSVMENLVRAVEKMPKPAQPRERRDATLSQPQAVREVDLSPVIEELQPHDEALFDLLEFLKTPGASVSLRAWQERFEAVDYLDPEDWMLYSSRQVIAAGHKVQFVRSNSGTQSINEVFSDIMVLS